MFNALTVAAWLLAAAVPAVAQVQQPAQGPILIGQSGGFTGGQADYARDVKMGIEAAFANANAAGGVQGRQIQLVTADDGGKREAVLTNTKKPGEHAPGAICSVEGKFEQPPAAFDR